jgi:hypothetical protein
MSHKIFKHQIKSRSESSVKKVLNLNFGFVLEMFPKFEMLETFWEEIKNLK